MVAIRIAEARDAAAIAHVHVQSWRETYAGIVPQAYLDALNETERAAQWREWLTRDVSVYVAEVEGEVVGFAGGGVIREPVAGYDAELYTIYLLRKVQSRGIGKALLDAVAKALIRRGHRSMIAWVLEENPAVGFYERAGARRVMSREIEIGGVGLGEVALGWIDLGPTVGLFSELVSD